MAFFRAYIAPLLVVALFLLALAVVSARFFLPDDMLAPAPTEGAANAAAEAPAAGEGP